MYLKQSGEDVELKHGHVVIAGEVYRRFQRHGLHPLLKQVDRSELLLESGPVHYAPSEGEREREVGAHIVTTKPTQHELNLLG